MKIRYLNQIKEKKTKNLIINGKENKRKEPDHGIYDTGS